MVFPEISQLRAFQCFADRTGIIELGHALMQETKNTPRIVVAQLRKIALGVPLEINPPSHNAS